LIKPGWFFMDELPLDFSTPKYDLAISPPLMNAAGSLGYAPQTSDLLNIKQLGAFVTNPISLYPRTPAKTRSSISFPGGFLLHSGYPNAGLRAAIKRYATRWARAHIPVIVHLLVHQEEDIPLMISRLEGREGVAGIELGIPPDCAPTQAVEIVQAAFGELPLIVRVPMEKAGVFAAALAESSLSAISLAPPRGALLDRQGQALVGRQFGPGVFPSALAAAREVIDSGVPLIAAGGIYEPEQVAALLEMGAIGVQLDAVLWSLREFEGWI
jgi:dihydroorotate dehydrogenase (NAD+) catalytic subunit